MNDPLKDFDKWNELKKISDKLTIVLASLYKYDLMLRKLFLNNIDFQLSKLSNIQIFLLIIFSILHRKIYIQPF